MSLVQAQQEPLLPLSGGSFFLPFQNSSQNDPFPSLFFHITGLFNPIITAFFIKQSTFFLKKNEQDGFLPRFTSFRYSKNQAIQGSAIRSIRKYKSRKPASAPYTSERLRRPSYPCRGEALPQPQEVGTKYAFITVSSRYY